MIAAETSYYHTSDGAPICHQSDDVRQQRKVKGYTFKRFH